MLSTAAKKGAFQPNIDVDGHLSPQRQVIMMKMLSKLHGAQSMHSLQHLALLSSYSCIVSHSSLTLI